MRQLKSAWMHHAEGEGGGGFKANVIAGGVEVRQFYGCCVCSQRTKYEDKPQSPRLAVKGSIAVHSEPK